MAGSYRVILLPEAYENLDAVLHFIGKDSPRNAAAKVDELQAAVESLGQFPHRYKVYQERSQRTDAVRSMPVPPYVIFYRILESARTIRVLTIRHGARKYPGRFR